MVKAIVVIGFRLAGLRTGTSISAASVSVSGPMNVSSSETAVIRSFILVFLEFVEPGPRPHSDACAGIRWPHKVYMT